MATTKPPTKVSKNGKTMYLSASGNSYSSKDPKRMVSAYTNTSGQKIQNFADGTKLVNGTMPLKDLSIGMDNGSISTQDQINDYVTTRGGKAPVIQANNIGNTGTFTGGTRVNDTTASTALYSSIMGGTGTGTTGTTGTGTTGTTGTGITGTTGTGTTGGRPTDALINQISGLITKQGEQDERQAALDKQYKIEQLQKDKDRISATILKTDRAYENKLRDMQDKGGGLEMGLAGEMDTLSRNRNRELADLAIQEAVAIQDLNSAMSIVDRKIKAEFEPLQNQITNLGNLYGMMQNDMSESEQLMAQAAINEKQADKTYAQNTATSVYSALFESGAITPDRLAMISDSMASATDAISNGQSPMKAVTSMYDALEGVISPQQRSLALQQASLAWDKEKFMLDLKSKLAETSSKTLEAERKAMDEATNALFFLQKKRGLTDLVVDKDGLPAHEGMKATVGAYGLARWTPLAVDKGAQKEFISIIDQLTNGMTLDELVSRKGSGATFGALTAPELKLLADSATKINSWRLTDDDRTYGFEIDEPSFLKEVQTIQGFIDLDIARKQIQTMSPDEIDALNAAYDATAGTSTTQVVDGSLFYPPQ